MVHITPNICAKKGNVMFQNKGGESGRATLARLQPTCTTDCAIRLMEGGIERWIQVID